MSTMMIYWQGLAMMKKLFYAWCVSLWITDVIDGVVSFCLTMNWMKGVHELDERCSRTGVTYGACRHELDER